MRGNEQGGFFYHVSDEQLRVFAGLSLVERLGWLDQARRFTLLAQTAETARRHARLRAGGAIDDGPPAAAG